VSLFETPLAGAGIQLSSHFDRLRDGRLSPQRRQTPYDLEHPVAEKKPTPKDLERPAREMARDREFLEAVARIYRRYGTDLSAFRRDVENELAKRESHSHA
jgi:hypothetical protein